MITVEELSRLVRSYAQHYAYLDYVIAAVAKGPVGAVRTGPEVIVPNRNAEFYAGRMRPNGLEDGLFVRLRGGFQPTFFLVTSADTPSRLRNGRR